MKFLPDDGTHGGTKSKRKYNISGLVCKLQTKIPKIPIFENATSTKYQKISDRYLKDWLFYRIICKMPRKAGL